MTAANQDSDAKAATRTAAWSLGLGVLGLLAVVPAVLGIFAPWGWERLTDAFPIGMRMLRACPLAIDALGDNPDKAWGMSNFEVGTSGQTGSATFTTQVAGTKGRGEYQVLALRTFDVWTVQSATLLLPDERRILDITTCTESPPPR